MNKTVAFNEGGMQEFCIMISGQSQERERNVNLDFLIIPFNETGCKNYSVVLLFLLISSFHITARSDLTLANMSMTISPSVSETCVKLISVDDDLIEDGETFSVVSVVQNANDRVNGNVTVVIFDNDGMLILWAG